MNWKQIQEMVDLGIVRIGSHSNTHRYFNRLDRHEVNRELLESQTCIEKTLPLDKLIRKQMYANFPEYACH